MYLQCFFQHIWTAHHVRPWTQPSLPLHQRNHMQARIKEDKGYDEPNHPEGASSSVCLLSKLYLFETPPHPILINSKQSLLNLTGMLNIGTTHSKLREQRTGVI